MSAPDPTARAATAVAHANIALIKYWGKRERELNLPAVGSLSITLQALETRTTVAFEPELERDRVWLNDREAGAEAGRVSATLDLLRAAAGRADRARVHSSNNFPTAAGLASSASGFAALVVAADAALGLALPPARLSEYARRGSGSAARSIFGGFGGMARGERADGSDAVAAPLLDAADWDLRAVIALTDRGAKQQGSTGGMELTASSSPYFADWCEGQESDLRAARRAVEARDFERLAELAEWSCLKMHATAMAARPGIVYWNGATVEALHRVRALRAAGEPVFFTVDAGPQLKAICLSGAAATVAQALSEVPGVLEVLHSRLGGPARVISGGG